jgi:anti-sigma regulatory factor (Ser/Thr protein kinase)
VEATNVLGPPEEPDITIELAGAYYFGQIERLIGQLQPLLTLKEPKRLLMDMSSLGFINPSALALLVATLTQVAESGNMIEGNVVRPNSPLTRHYLQRMDFERLLLPDADPEAFERKDPKGFRPCVRFQEPKAARQAAADLSAAVAESCKREKLAAAALDITLSELADNVLHHADADSLGGFATAQALKTKPLLEVAIADLGVGVLASLRKNPDYADTSDDPTALELALMPRVTSTPDRNSGIGLFITQILLATNGGELLLRSGTASIHRGSRNETVEREHHLPGTLVTLRVRTDRPLDMKRVYKALSDALGLENDVDPHGPGNDD